MLAERKPAACCLQKHWLEPGALTFTLVFEKWELSALNALAKPLVCWLATDEPELGTAVLRGVCRMRAR